MRRHVPRAGALAIGVALGALSLAAEAGAQAPPTHQGAIHIGERWVCRPADAGHPANASSTNSKTSMHCTPINATVTTKSGRVIVIGTPETNAATEQVSVTIPATGGMTAIELNQRYVEMMRKSLEVEGPHKKGAINVGARWVCRPVNGTHPQNAALNAPATPLSCRAVNFSMTTTSGETIVVGHPAQVPTSVDTTEETGTIAAPNYAGTLTSEQQSAAWNDSVYRVFDIADSAAG
jgi:hypothetical protein